jgi:S-DNA-T family DNA segregation ATPase FtsK/SpoIIIE
MSRKTPDSHHGFNDVIGVALLAVALLLLVAQFSFDRNDISFLTTQANASAHNWIKTPGAYLAWGTFLLFGIVGYIVPWLLALFGLAHLVNFPGYLRERSQWSLLWSAVLLISVTGLLHMMDGTGLFRKWEDSIGLHSAGGLLGWITYGQTSRYNFGFSLLGPVGATIIYSALCLISLLFLTNFRLGVWIRAALQKDSAENGPEKSADEAVLERHARELERQAKKLQEEVARSGLGADGLPVPEPTVRDLSVPQAKSSGARIRKTTLPEPPKPVEPAPAAEGEIVPSPNPSPSPPPPHRQLRIAAAGFSPIPDTTVKPTESKEELMANARLMQQTLAQFDIEVSLGDITKGPTITRYELHPAPGVKLEKITALSNNIAAALKAERINILAPVPGKSSVGVEVPNAVKTKVIMRDLFESEEWAPPRPAFRSPWARMSMACPSSPIWRRCRICSSPAAPVPANPSASTPSSPPCFTNFRPTSCAS